MCERKASYRRCRNIQDRAPNSSSSARNPKSRNGFCRRTRFIMNSPCGRSSVVYRLWNVKKCESTVAIVCGREFRDRKRRAPPDSRPTTMTAITVGMFCEGGKYNTMAVTATVPVFHTSRRRNKRWKTTAGSWLSPRSRVQNDDTLLLLFLLPR